MRKSKFSKRHWLGRHLKVVFCSAPVPVVNIPSQVVSARRAAICACTHTPDEPHNNCVRKCLQSKMWSFLAANAEDLRSGRFIWCPSIWKHHRECYSECACDNSFIGLEAFLLLCTETFSCPSVGLSIALFNACMEPEK